MDDKQKSIHAFFGGKDTRECAKDQPVTKFFKPSQQGKAEQKVAVKRPREEQEQKKGRANDAKSESQQELTRVKRKATSAPPKAKVTAEVIAVEAQTAEEINEPPGTPTKELADPDDASDTPIVEPVKKLKQTHLSDGLDKPTAKPAKKPKKSDSSGGAEKSKGKSTAEKVEGVGIGALAAAAEHALFDLSKSATWAPGEPVPYSFLVATFEAISETTKRLAIVTLLTNAFRTIIARTPQDLLLAVYLCINKVAPAHAGIELGIGDATLIKALAQGTGRQESQIKKEYDEAGDLGIVACASRGKQRTMFQPKPLTVQSVFKTLKDIAAFTGNKSQDAKRGLIMKLLVAAKDAEPGYLVRSLQGKLRIGLAEQSVLSALAHSVLLQSSAPGCYGGPSPPPLPKGDALANALEHAAKEVRNAFSECPSYDILVPALLQHGLGDLLSHVHFAPGTPVKAMLARATTGVSEVLDKFADCEFTCEYKYDGERAQVHVLEDGSVQVYSRNLENTTSKYPDIVSRMPACLAPGVKSIVLDCEAQAWDPERKVFLPFQVLTTRSRKDVKIADIKVQVVLFAFDCLYVNGDVMLRRPLTERREALYRSIVPEEGKIQFATAKTSRDLEELQAFLEEAVADCTEGLIVKTLADTYEPSKRSLNWLKLKKDYLEGCGDTFDVAIVGALYGRGKRTGLFGSFLLAIYNEEREEYQTISKIGTGFSEEVLKELSERLRQQIIDKPRSYYRYTDRLIPDVWFDVKAVWEVKAADLSISPVYTAAAGLVDPNKGISIRFPRLVRERDDKGPEETTSPAQVAEMYKRQAVMQGSAKAAKDDDDDW